MATTTLVPATSSTLVQTHQYNKYAPILLDGELQPADLHIWEQSANRYFTQMKIPETEKVDSILSSFRALEISNWIQISRDTFSAEDYTFANFMFDFRERFLERGWARRIYRSEIKRMMSSTQRFIDYANRVVYYNIILKGTEHYSDHKKLRETFVDHMSEGLIDEVDALSMGERSRIHAIADLNDWMKEIENIDRTRKKELERTVNMIHDFLNQRMRDEPHPNNYASETHRVDNSSRENGRYHPYRTYTHPHPKRDRAYGPNKETKGERGTQLLRNSDQDHSNESDTTCGYENQNRMNQTRVHALSKILCQSPSQRRI